MLRLPRLVQLFRQPSVYDGLLTASTQRTVINRLPASPSQFIAKQRLFSTARSTRQWGRYRISPLPRASQFRAARNVRHNGTKVVRTEQTGESANLSLSDRMKQMSRKYGWTVVGIYLGLSVLDFPFCFLAVRLFGTERIGQVEHALIDSVWKLLESVVPSLKERRQQKELEAAQEEDGHADSVAESAVAKHAHEDASIWTQLLIAYGVHKSLIFIRIPITLAITPKVVKVLRSWGWKIGKTVTKTA